MQVKDDGASRRKHV